MDVYLKCFYLLLAVWHITANAKDCKLQLPKLSFFAPLVFTMNGTLKTTESNDIDDNNFVRIPSEEKVILSCAPNYFKSIESISLEATCNGDDILVINGENKNFLKDLSCEVRAIEEVLVAVTGCESKYQSIEFGYTNPITLKSHVLGAACYDEQLGKTVFVHIKSKSNFLNTEIDQVSLKVIDVNYFKKKHPMSRYKLDFLTASRFDLLTDRMTESLGAENVPDSLNQNYFLGMNMLMNRQFYSTLKLGWNYVMFNGFDTAANLAVLESDILKLKSEKSLELYIGSNDVLKVHGMSGDTELYLKDGRFPVPKYIWIGVRNENKFVGFALVNSPVTEADIFFASKCDQITWLKQLFKTKLVEDRKIVCCEYRNFKNNVPEMPELTGTFDLFV